MIIPRDDMSVTDFYDFPEEYRDVLEAAKLLDAWNSTEKQISAPYVDRAVQKILTDPNADPENGICRCSEAL